MATASPAGAPTAARGSPPVAPRPGRPLPARATVRRLPPAPDLVLGGIVCFLVCVAWRLPWLGDLGQHAAVLERLTQNLSDPGSPLVERPGDSSPYYTPYTVLAALLARLTGLSTFATLSVCATVNAVALLAALRRFVRTLSSGAWAPVFATLCMLFLWGTHLFLWGGHTSLSALCLSLSYPSTFALALGLHLWARLMRATRGRTGAGHWAVTGVLVAVLVLIHPVMAVGALIGCGAVCAGTVRGRDRSTLARGAAAGVGVLLPLLLWPYGNVLSIPDSSALDSFHIAAYTSMPERYGLALIAVPVLLLRHRRSRRDPLVLLCLGTAGVAAAGWCTGHYTWGRVLPYLLLGLQCAVAVEVCAPWPRARVERMRRTLLAAVLAVALPLGARAQAGALLYLVPPELMPRVFTAHVQFLPPWPGWEWAMRHVRPGDVVLTNHYVALRMLPGYGAYTVMPAWPQPEIPVAENARRATDMARALNGRTDARLRRKAVCSGGADWLLLTPSQSIPPGQGFFTVATGPDKSRLVRVDLNC
ncbi:hypothetical protein ACIO3O_17920 [Streptomyces sp. NPDC087440]|uniref:hypothetical protein n=1 Tax=Streptomyces sp. NPDC087440 TaxID=3365790 RepID=UPI0037FA61A1